MMGPLVARVVAIATVSLSAVAYAQDAVWEYTLPNNARVRIVEETFDHSQHRIEKCKGADFPCKIDGRFPFGTSFNFPVTRLKEITVTVSGTTYRLNTSGMYNAWGGRELVYKGHKYFSVTCGAQLCSVKGVFSDGVGSYVAEWHLSDGRSKRVLLTNNEARMSRFMAAIDKE